MNLLKWEMMSSIRHCASSVLSGFAKRDGWWCCKVEDGEKYVDLDGRF